MKNNSLKIIPEPFNSSIGDGVFILNSDTKIIIDDFAREVVNFLIKFLKEYRDLNLLQKKYSKEINYNNAIILKRVNKNTEMHREGYFLNISKTITQISATELNGLFYGIQTLTQIIFLENTSNTERCGDLTLPCLEISDFPRFTWRGFMLDEARHFFGKEIVKKLLDIMALLKFNIFHWHLTDDQGWRVEIKKYPLLTEISSKREGTITSKANISLAKNKKKMVLDNIPIEGYYTYEDLKEIIQYAKDRYITIIPEIDLPGHVTAVLAAYPELSCTGSSFNVSPLFGIHKDVFCIGNEKVLEFSKNVLSEIMDIFPSKYIHTGGDEVPTYRWKKCEKCQKKLIQEGLNDVKELQNYFTFRINSFLDSREHILIGWNEILNDNLDIKAICQYWTNNFDRLIKNIKRGRKVIMSEMSTLYLNHPIELITLQKTYEYEPIPSELDERHIQNVIGLEACLWTEGVKDMRMLELRTYPRLLAVGEIGWSTKKNKNFSRFQEKFKLFTTILDYYKINYEYKGN